MKHWAIGLVIGGLVLILTAQVPVKIGTGGSIGSGADKEVAYYNGAGRLLAGAKGLLYTGTASGGSLELFDLATLAAESLTNGALTAGTSWTQTGDMALAADAATYTHSTAVGTLQQASGTLAIAGVASRHYRFAYTVSAVTAGVSCNITTAFALVATNLTLTAGVQNTDFVSAASPGNFVVSCTSTAGAVTLDALSLKEARGGDATVVGSVKASSFMPSGGTKFTASGCTNSATVGGATAGKFTSGTTGACTVTITMNGAVGLTAPNGWHCTASDETTPANLISQSASTTTTATITGTTVTSDVISFSCFGY